MTGAFEVFLRRRLRDERCFYWNTMNHGWITNVDEDSLRLDESTARELREGEWPVNHEGASGDPTYRE